MRPSRFLNRRAVSQRVAPRGFELCGDTSAPTEWIVEPGRGTTNGTITKVWASTVGCHQETGPRRTGLWGRQAAPSRRAVPPQTAEQPSWEWEADTHCWHRRAPSRGRRADAPLVPSSPRPRQPPLAGAAPPAAPPWPPTSATHPCAEGDAPPRRGARCRRRPAAAPVPRGSASGASRPGSVKRGGAGGGARGGAAANGGCARGGHARPRPCSGAGGAGRGCPRRVRRHRGCGHGATGRR